jgi:DNA-binding MarR family transcriptional regulator
MSDRPSIERCPYVVGDDGVARWTETHAAAWTGLLDAHRAITRALETELEAEHGLSLSSVEALGRLAGAEQRRLRLTALAGATGLSVSRTSRIVDFLEQRGLVERRPVADDARAVEVQLTAAGRAQATHFASVQKRFFDQLDAGELATLATVFGRLTAPAPAGS